MAIDIDPQDTTGGAFTPGSTDDPRDTTGNDVDPGAGEPDTPGDFGGDNVDLGAQINDLMEIGGAATQTPTPYNTDLDGMTDEEVVQFAVDHPQAIRARATKQSALDRERHRLEQAQAAQQQQPDQAPQAPQSPVSTPDETPYVRRDPSAAATPAEAFQIAEENAAARIRQEMAQGISGIQQEQIAIQNQQLANQVEQGFQELERKVPATAGMRAQIWEHMQARGIPDPGVAFLDLKKDGLLSVLANATGGRERRSEVPPTPGGTRSSTQAKPPDTSNMSLPDKRKEASRMAGGLTDDDWDARPED